MKTINKKIPTIELSLSGTSTPEDPNEFYVPFCESLKAFCKPTTGMFNFIFSIKLGYYNSGSARYMSSIMKMLKPLVRKRFVTINWHYYKTDEDMYEMGKDFTETLGIKINFIKEK